MEPGEIIACWAPTARARQPPCALSGVIPAQGRILCDGVDLIDLHPAKRVEMGLAHVPQGRGTFINFSVEENLELGAYTVKSRRQIASDIARWFDVFPRLRERRRQPAGTLSGGEQQMLAIARALMSRPRLLMCDEPSLGLAPAITQEMFNIFRRINEEERTTLLIVEQNADLTLRIAHRAYVMEVGAITTQGTAEELLASPSIQRSYLGA
ncbi:ABC transporter ATP-binding protein [Polaromonas sp. P1(28)-8]|nr:ABC transporter ATP-binding protein [Polaromonas sp. P1(28)-8]